MVKGQYGSLHHGHGKEATALEPLRLWTSSIGELFFIEQRLSAAKVWQVGQSWVETTVLYKFTRGKMDLQHRLSFAVVSSRGHLEIIKTNSLMPEVLAITETNYRAEHTKMTE